MSKEYIIYCDESDGKGSYYSNFYGGALIRSRDLNLVEQTLNKKKLELNLNQEIKWTKITLNYCEKYLSILECFFDFVKNDKIKVRIMFTQNAHIVDNLSSYHKEHEYFILYYQFIKHAFGLMYCTEYNELKKLRLYFDRFPVATKEKITQFKAYLCGLSLNPGFRDAKILIEQDQVVEVDSHKHIILQCLDIVLGSIQFRLNDKHKQKIPGTNKKGNRTIAKERVYNHINSLIQDIYPKFNIGCSTSIKCDKNNLWEHSYRHWVFKSKDGKFDHSRTKKKNPASAMSNISNDVS